MQDFLFKDFQFPTRNRLNWRIHGFHRELSDVTEPSVTRSNADDG